MHEPSREAMSWTLRHNCYFCHSSSSSHYNAAYDLGWREATVSVENTTLVLIQADARWQRIRLQSLTGPRRAMGPRFVVNFVPSPPFCLPRPDYIIVAYYNNSSDIEFGGRTQNIALSSLSPLARLQRN